MIRVLGSCLVFGGGGLLWWRQLQERRRRRRVLADLLRILRSIQEEIRMTRRPLPELFEKMTGHCGTEVAELLQSMAVAIAGGRDADETWDTGVFRLPLSNQVREILLGLTFNGDEDKVCKEVALVIYGLSNCAEELDRSRAEEDKRSAALCFSGAALLVILLI